MKTQRTSSGMTRRNFLKGLVYGGLAISPFGCITSGKRSSLFGNYGSLKSSKEVTRDFRNYEVKDDHNYWIAGTDKKSPDAILGLDKEYTLDSRFWYPLNSQDKTLRELVENMNDEADNIPYGADVLDHNKNDIGDWYSTANSTTVKIDGRIVQVYTPSSSRSGGGSKSKGKGKGPSGSGK